MKTQSIYFFLLSFLLVFFSCTEDPVTGCIDAAACNYNSEAEEDDGSCEYTTCSGCTNLDACNYNSDATISDNESCQFPLENPIQITSYDDLVVGSAGEELEAHFYIQNASCSSISIDASQLTGIHTGQNPGVTFRICLGDNCYNPGVTEAAIPLNLDSFVEGDYFQGYLMSPNPASFNITYRFFTESNYEERTVEFQFN